MIRRAELGERGFTLIELLTTFIVMSTLAGIALPTIRTAVERADATHVVTDARNVETAVITYYENTGLLPATTGWGVSPPELSDMISSLPFVYKDCDYRIITSGGSGTVRLRVRYPNGSPIGEALQAYQSPGKVVWTRTRTDFYLLT